MPDPGDRVRRRRGLHLVVGGGLLLAYLTLAVLGPWVVPYGANDQDLLGVLAPASGEHWLGTDQIGRDLLSRLVVGARFTLTAAVVSVTLAAALGATLGLVAGYVGGRVDAVLMGFADLLLTVPNLILAIAIASVVGAGMTGLVAATTGGFVAPLARLIRGRVLEVRQEDFVQAAVAAGLRDTRILTRHVLPHATNLAEGIGSNVFLVRDGAIYTPREQFVLPGISRETAIDLGRELGYTVHERDIDLFDAYNADEAFLTSTSLCVCPVRSFNGVELGAGQIPGPVTRRVIEAYCRMVDYDFVAQYLKRLER